MDNCDGPVAHIPIPKDGRCHYLEEHLKKTSELASEFAQEFGCPEWARLAGLWHVNEIASKVSKYVS